jgi:hypothetical protein
VGWFIDDIDALADDPAIPLTARPALELYGFPPFGGDDAHPSDLYDAYEVEKAGRSTEALYYALKAQQLTATVDPVAGHKHNTEDTLIDWIPLLRVSPMNALQNGVSRRQGFVQVDSATYKTLGWGIFAMPAGHLVRPVLFPRMRGYAPQPGAAAGVILDVEIALFNAISGGSNVNLAAAPLATRVMRLADGTGFLQQNVWVEGDPIDLAGEAANISNINGRFLVYARSRARIAVAGSSAAISEIQLGWRYGK